MEIGYKPTTHGRALLAKLMALESPLKLSRVAFGSGRVPDGTNLADVHELVSYVVDGEVAERRHDGDSYYLTVQYTNALHMDLPLFYIGEFMVYATDPETGEEVDLLYATLGDYQTPMPKYREDQGAVLFNLPLVLLISDEIEVKIDAAPGLITYEDLQTAVDEAVKEATKDIGGIVLSLPFSVEPKDWNNGESGKYPSYADIVDARIRSGHVPIVVYDDESMDAVADCGGSTESESYTGYVRIKAKTAATANITGIVYLIGKATGGGGDYELPVATDTILGGVKIKNGGGLKIDGLGNLALDAATEQDVKDLYDEAEASAEE